MKKLSLFVLLIAATFTSCSSDDDSTSGISEANLIGKWQWSASVINGVAETLNECDMMDTVEFGANGVITTTTFFSNGVVVDGQTTVTCEEDFSGTGEWSLSGDVISVTFGASTGTVKILELTGTTLKFEDVDEFTDGQGNTETDVYIDTYTRI